MNSIVLTYIRKKAWTFEKKINLTNISRTFLCENLIFLIFFFLSEICRFSFISYNPSKHVGLFYFKMHFTVLKLVCLKCFLHRSTCVFYIVAQQVSNTILTQVKLISSNEDVNIYLSSLMFSNMGDS